MKRYAIAEHELKELIKIVFSQNQTPYAIHEQWPQLVKLAGEITEITALEIYKSEDPAMNALCRPILMAGAKIDRMFESDWAYNRKMDTISFNHRPWLVYSDIRDLEALPIKMESLEEIYEIFKRIIARSTKQWSLICGPITTGGLGDRILNLDLFHQHIVAETNKGFQVFNQMPFERKLMQISDAFPKAFTKKKNPILDVVYLPLIKAKKFEPIKMMPTWETSDGATQEHNAAREVELIVHFLNPLPVAQKKDTQMLEKV